MIQVSWAAMILLPLLFALVAVFACGLYYAARQEQPAKDGRRMRIYRCSVCHHVYVDPRDVPMLRCPRCSCMNEAVKR